MKKDEIYGHDRLLSAPLLVQGIGDSSNEISR